jgi:hypothetical protein
MKNPALKAFVASFALVITFASCNTTPVAPAPAKEYVCTDGKVVTDPKLCVTTPVTPVAPQPLPKGSVGRVSVEGDKIFLTETNSAKTEVISTATSAVNLGAYEFADPKGQAILGTQLPLAMAKFLIGVGPVKGVDQISGRGLIFSGYNQPMLSDVPTGVNLPAGYKCIFAEQVGLNKDWGCYPIPPATVAAKMLAMSAAGPIMLKPIAFIR